MTAPHIEAQPTEGGFLLRNVRIGIGFHWDRHEDQTFQGQLHILNHPDGTQTAVNELDIEDYLCSVISSEMNSHSPMELLKAHAVISRSWAMRAIQANRETSISSSYESNGHVGFDVCADDHCQRYEGTHRITEQAAQAVRETAGQVLWYDGQICDTRFHKCCGGRTERFSTCWEDTDVPYLQPVDCPYCATDDQSVLQTVLNDYDRETRDFHDWEVAMEADELSSVFRRKSGIDVGGIKQIIPLRRGASGRIYEMEIVGEKRSVTIGKELKIRRFLSPTCLYSSWFDVQRSGTRFLLRGHGWGHGVGLCQIGAAVMAEQGKTYEQILQYYYSGTHLQQL